MKNRNEYLVNNKLALVKNLDIFLEGMEAQQVMIVKSNISLEKLTELLTLFYQEDE